MDDRTFTGEAYALSMHPKIFRAIATKETTVQILQPQFVANIFAAWLNRTGSNETFTVAGKNYAGFDRQFLQKLPHWKDTIKEQHGVLDPGSLYYDPLVDDVVPSMATCMERAGIPGEVAHTAVEDALIVVKLLRNVFEETPCFASK